MQLGTEGMLEIPEDVPHGDVLGVVDRRKQRTDGMEMVEDHVTLGDALPIRPFLEGNLLQPVNLLFRKAVGITVVGQIGDPLLLGDPLEIRIDVGSGHIPVDLPLEVVSVMGTMLLHVRRPPICSSKSSM